VHVHLIDGTYELFRHFFAVPPHTRADGQEVGAVRGVLASLVGMLEEGATHVGVATDHVIESFRNDLYPGYKTGDGMDPKLFAQFGPAEDACRALGIVTWPMIEFECDDALAAGAARFAALPEVEQVVICSPDKDLAQCVTDTRVVCLDRMRKKVLDEPGVHAKFGVGPKSMPDWLALVGDSADGYPGIARWGAKSAAAVLAVYEHLERIPDDATSWFVTVRGAEVLARNLRENRDAALLYRRLATLRTDVPLAESLDDLRWRGGDKQALASLSAAVVDDWVERRAAALVERRG
jgi:5'-3' exonuclease